MIRWIRVVVPVSALFGIALVYLVSELWLLRQEQRWGFKVATFERPTVLLLLFTAAGYGVYRVVAFHPALRSKYRAWLKTTPWVRGRALPLGPVEIVLQDLVIVWLFAMLPYELAGLDPLVLAQVFLASYLVVLACTLDSTGPWPLGQLVGFGLGLALLYARQPALCVMILAVVYLLAYLGLWRSLAYFPWEDRKPDLTLLVGSVTTNQQSPAAELEKLLGWPHFRLGPSIAHFPAGALKRSVVSSLLAGWLYYAFLAALGDRAFVFAASAFVNIQLTFLLAMLRLGRYVMGYAPPVNFWGRLMRGTWIIPAYDKVLVAPLVILAVGLATPALLYLGGLPMEMASAIGLALTLLFQATLGPDYKQWCLTGHHRITPCILNRKELIEG